MDALSPESRPTPKFWPHTETFSSKKKERSEKNFSSRELYSTRSVPRLKSNKKVFHNKPDSTTLPVFFKQNEFETTSPLYNEHDSQLFVYQCFTVQEKLGSGSFGEVYKVRSKEDGNFYAIKCSKDKFRSQAEKLRRMEEVAKYQKLPPHPNCVKFIQAWEEKNRLYIQTELCKNSLQSYADCHHNIPESLIWKYLVDLLMALKHLHDHNFAHMDIKPDNIFIDNSGILKLGDYGLVLDLSKKCDTSEAQEGDPKYMAPELLDGKFEKPADIFSLGITILELATDLSLPMSGKLWHMLRNADLPEEFLNGISTRLSSIIKWMMTPDPQNRPNVDQLLTCQHIYPIYYQRWCYISFLHLLDHFDSILHVARSVLNLCWSSIKYPFNHVFCSSHLVNHNRSDATPVQLSNGSTSNGDLIQLNADDLDSVNTSNRSSDPRSSSRSFSPFHTSEEFTTPYTFSDEAQARPIEPKNLMDVFESLSSDEESS